jgi:hypothetical protein
MCFAVSHSGLTNVKSIIRYFFRINSCFIEGESLLNLQDCLNQSSFEGVFRFVLQVDHAGEIHLEAMRIFELVAGIGQNEVLEDIEILPRLICPQVIVIHDYVEIIIQNRHLHFDGKIIQMNGDVFKDL